MSKSIYEPGFITANRLSLRRTLIRFVPVQHCLSCTRVRRNRRCHYKLQQGNKNKSPNLVMLYYHVLLLLQAKQFYWPILHYILPW